MNELLKINFETEEPTVSARDLHEQLHIKTAFKEMYDQYYSEIIKELPTGENSVDVAKNPFNLSNYR